MRIARLAPEVTANSFRTGERTVMSLNAAGARKGYSLAKLNLLLNKI